MGTDGVNELRTLCKLGLSRVKRAERDLDEARRLLTRLSDAIDQLDTSEEDTSDEYPDEEQARAA
jgi:hypothetical protein